MSKRTMPFSRRRFLKTATQASGLLVLPQLVPGSALGMDGSVAPSNLPLELFELPRNRFLLFLRFRQLSAAPIALCAPQLQQRR